MSLRGCLDAVRESWRAARWNRQEMAGSLGDLGTFLPLMLAMVSVNGLDFASALFFAGLFNVITGITFRIPMAVQPMKAIAAVAIVYGLSAAQIVAAGAAVSGVIVLLGVTGLIERVHRLTPSTVIRGVQLAVGISLLMKGIEMAVGPQRLVTADGWIVSIIAATLALTLLASRRAPAGLVLFGLGLGLTALTAPEAWRAISLGFHLPAWRPPDWSDFAASFTKAAVPQIPLTVLNSVIAVCALAADLFPQHAPSPRKVAVSVGLMNLTACWFGAMPMCHGAGGLAGQYRFGARTNGAILMLGAAKMAIAISFGSSLLGLCHSFPVGVLGVMVALSGLELASGFADLAGRSERYVVLSTAGAALALGNVALGLIVGLAVALCLRWADPFGDGSKAVVCEKCR